MTGEGRLRICPVERAGHLDNRFRSWIQNPRKILSPYIAEGMTALDLGCGPGFFAIEMARLVGKTGRVIAADLQEGMLNKLKDKINGTELAPRIALHTCEETRIGLSEPVDFVLAFYVLHEIPDQDRLFHEIARCLKSTGQMLIVEPPFHVSKSAFEAMIVNARNAGLTLVKRPRVLLSKTALLQRQ